MKQLGQMSPFKFYISSKNKRKDLFNTMKKDYPKKLACDKVWKTKICKKKKSYIGSCSIIETTTCFHYYNCVRFIFF